MSSDDSDFYGITYPHPPISSFFVNTRASGEEDLVTDLKRKVDDLDVKQWWQEYEALETPLKLQARGNVGDISQFHNPYAGLRYAWQLTESVDAFLNRLPPATTEETPGNSWIWICNPYIKRKSKSEAENQLVRGGEDEAPEDEGADLATLMKAGSERLEFASSFINEYRKSGHPKFIIAREARKAGMDAANDILGLARELRVTCGKWMLFCTVFQVNEVWEIIAKATANNELGIAAKVAPKSNVDHRTERLICVYTADFSDKQDVARVAERLKLLGLVGNKPLYYKPDAYTYFGIASGNPWEIRPSIYDTRSLLGK